MKRISLTAIMLIVASFAFSEPLKELSDVKKILDQSMNKIEQNKYVEAVVMLKPYSSIDSNKFGIIENQLASQKDAILGNYGKVIKTEYWKLEKVGENLIRITEISWHEKYGLCWMFTFYNGNDGWKLVNFVFDDKLEKLM